MILREIIRIFIFGFGLSLIFSGQRDVLNATAVGG